MGRLEKELAEARNHYEQLLATVNNWVAWRGSITSEEAKLKESQSALLTAVDPALEAKLAVSAQSPSKLKQATAQKPTLEHLPSAIAQAIEDDDDVAQGGTDSLEADASWEQEVAAMSLRTETNGAVPKLRDDM